MKLLHSAIGATLLAWSIATSAASITVTWDSPIVNPNGINAGTITHPDGTVNANVGRFVGTVSGPHEVDPERFVGSDEDFYAYCHDLAQRISSGETRTYNVTFGANDAILDFLGAVNAHFGGGNYRWLTDLTSSQAGMIQLGIWEGLHDDDFVLTTGDVRFSNVSSDVTDLFNEVVALMGGNVTPNLAPQYVMVLHNDQVQDVITGYGRPQQVPEPGTLALLGFAVAAAGVARRRR